MLLTRTSTSKYQTWRSLPLSVFYRDSLPIKTQTVRLLRLTSSTFIHLVWKPELGLDHVLLLTNAEALGCYSFFYCPLSLPIRWGVNGCPGLCSEVLRTADNKQNMNNMLLHAKHRWEFFALILAEKKHRLTSRLVVYQVPSRILLKGYLQID